MKRLADGVAVLLLAVLLSACGSQPKQAYGGRRKALNPQDRQKLHSRRQKNRWGNRQSKIHREMRKQWKTILQMGKIQRNRREAVLWQKRIHLTLKRKRSR